MKNNNFKLILRKILSFFTYNWQYKLLALILGIGLWSGLITQDSSLTREKVFTDVTINVTGSETLRRNGFIVTSGLDDLPQARLKVEVPQNLYNTVTPANYNIRIDLSKIRGAGEQTLSVVGTSSTAYGSVMEISVGTVTLQVDEYVTRSRIPVRLETSGTLPEGFYGSTATVDPLYVSVSGPKSLVNTIVRCVAEYNMDTVSSKSGTERTAVPFRLVAADNSAVDSSLVEVTTESVLLDSLIVEQTLYPSKLLTVNTADLINGTPAEGYSVKRITAEPTTLLVAGNELQMSTMDELHLVEFVRQLIDITGAAETLHRNITINKPSGIVYTSYDTLMITIEITPD